MTDPNRSAPSQAGADARAQAYWRANLRVIALLLAVWFFASFGCGILFVDALNAYHFFGFKLGFWFAQQGAIYIFVGLIFIYVWWMNRLEGNLSDDQFYLIHVTDVDRNRAPYFTTPPIVDAYVNVEYTYPSDADDPDGDLLTYAVYDGPDGMQINAGTGLVKWTPSADQVGTLVPVTLWVDDSLSRGNVAPIAVDDNLATTIDQPVTFDALANDLDPEGDPISILSVTQSTNGSVSIADGLVTFTPIPGFVGTATFTYTLRDLFGDQDTGTVSVVVVIFRMRLRKSEKSLMRLIAGPDKC